jgi:hypothetical protein
MRGVTRRAVRLMGGVHDEHGPMQAVGGERHAHHCGTTSVHGHAGPPAHQQVVQRRVRGRIVLHMERAGVTSGRVVRVLHLGIRPRRGDDGSGDGDNG